MKKEIKLPTIYKTTKTGAIQQWTVWSYDGKVYTEFGKEGGKLTLSDPTFCEGKNTGRANETNADDQAKLEASSMWAKKMKSGYAERDATGAIINVERGGWWPMLASKYAECKDSIVFPCLSQPKLDGHRCSCQVKDGKCTLWSKKREPILSMPHIVAAIEALNFTNINLDGELYRHGYTIEDLSHYIRSATPVIGHEIVQIHLYDININQSMGMRSAALSCIKAKLKPDSPIVIVNTVKIKSEADIDVFFNKCIADKYEGCMLRNEDSVYLSVPPPGRSRDLVKVKKMDDGEFKILDINPGNGKFIDCAIFTCELPNKGTVDVSMSGPLADRKKYLDNPKSYIGKDLTVQYQGFTKLGSLKFPVGLRIREDI